MENYVCTLCGYIYKPEENNNVEFNELEESWVCPICQASKDEFEKI